MRILVAEDEPQLANSLKRNFEAEGHQAVIACNGKQVLDILSRKHFDVLLLDWRMPKLSGIEVCKRLRTAGNDIPIILLTALSNISHKLEALHLGADDYITKPFSFEEVLARIHAVVRRSRSATPVVRFGSLELNLITRILKTPCGELKLPEKEFELLHYFIRHPNSIISKEQLAKEVWQLPFYPTTNFIEATVKNLRKKLEAHCGKKFIQTIYAEGYILLPDE